MSLSTTIPLPRHPPVPVLRRFHVTCSLMLWARNAVDALGNAASALEHYDIAGKQICCSGIGDPHGVINVEEIPV